MFAARCIKYFKQNLQHSLKLFPPNGMNVCKLSTVTNDRDNHIVWIDMEMTGLDIRTAQVLEVACLVTDKNLKVISEEFNIVVHHSDKILTNMELWSQECHKSTGLIAESRSSEVNIQDVDNILLDFLQKYIPKRKCPMAGNSAYMDRMFLNKYMTTVDDYLHHRIIDTSSIKELIRIWSIDVPKLKKHHVHRALPDTKESIRELELYKKHLFHL